MIRNPATVWNEEEGRCRRTQSEKSIGFLRHPSFEEKYTIATLVVTRRPCAGKSA